MVWDNLKNGLTDAANQAAKTVSDIGSNIGAGVQAVSNTVQATRHASADIIGHTGRVTGTAVHVAEEIAAHINVNNALVVGMAFTPLIFILDIMPIQHNGNSGYGRGIMEKVGDLSKLIRGNEPQLLSLYVTKNPIFFSIETDIKGCMYDPKFGDEMGLIEYSENDLADRLAQETTDAGKKPFIYALASMQFAKRMQYIPLATPARPEISDFSVENKPKVQSLPELYKPDVA